MSKNYIYKLIKKYGRSVLVISHSTGSTTKKAHFVGRKEWVKNFVLCCHLTQNFGQEGSTFQNKLERLSEFYCEMVVQCQ